MMTGMRFQHSVRYDAPVAEVFAMLTDPAFREAVGAAQDARSVSAKVEAFKVTLDMETPNRDLPGFARAFAGETTRSITTEDWREGHEAAFRVETPGKPSSIAGTRRLVADGDGTLDTFEAEAKAKVPIVGGKIEALIVSQFRDGCAKEHAVGVTWLKGE